MRVVETLTVHARILTDFYLRGRDKPDDAIADDYVPDWRRSATYGWASEDKMETSGRPEGRWALAAR